MARQCGVEVNVDVEDAVTAWVRGVLVPADRRPIARVLEHHRFVRWDQVGASQAFGNPEDLGAAQEFERSRAPFIVEVVDPVHDFVPTLSHKAVIVISRGCFSRPLPLRYPVVSCLLEARQHGGRDPVTEDQVTLPVERLNLLAGQAVRGDWRSLSTGWGHVRNLRTPGNCSVFSSSTLA